MARVFDVAPESISETMNASDVDGWDSLSHLIVLTALEKAFDVELPMERAHAAQDVGALVTIISESVGGS